MNSGKSIFAQLMDFLPSKSFQRCVQRYQGDYKRKTFSCWDQFLCMSFAQLTYRESLRDIEACLRAQQFHLKGRGCFGYLVEKDRSFISLLPQSSPVAVGPVNEPLI